MFPFLKVAITNLFKKPSTVKYPGVEAPAKPAYRGRIEYDGDKCVNCGMCKKVCSPGAITTVEEETPEGKDIHYTFDLTSCTFCGMCQDFCDEKAIKLTADYHMVETDSAKLVSTGTCHKKAVKGKLVCGSDCVYCTLCAKKCPNGAITVDRANKTWVVDESKCTKCGICVSTCPKHALEFAAAVRQFVACDTEKCIHCYNCETVCPNGCITVDRSTQVWSYDPTHCTHCNTCISQCPKAALSMKAEAITPEVKCDEAACVHCTLCAKKCPSEAITVDRETKTWTIDKSKCIQCGKCVSICPKKALTL